MAQQPPNYSVGNLGEVYFMNKLFYLVKAYKYIDGKEEYELLDTDTGERHTMTFEPSDSK